MLEYRAKTLVRLLVGMGLNTMVGITAEQFGDDDWNVVLAPMQTVDIVQLGMKLHFHGFGCTHGQRVAQNGQPVVMPDGSIPIDFMFHDNLPETLPEADEVEEVGPELPRNRSEGTYIRFTAGSFSGNPSPPQAKTGCEGIWTPGDGDGGYEF